MAVCIRTAKWLRKRLIIWIILNCIRTRSKITVWKKLTGNGRITKKLKFTACTICRFN